MEQEELSPQEELLPPQAELMTASSPKAKKKKWYQQYFNDKWLNDPQLRDWIRKNDDDRSVCYCIYCNVKLKNANRSMLLKHRETTKHKKKVISMGGDAGNQIDWSEVLIEDVDASGEVKYRDHQSSFADKGSPFKEQLQYIAKELEKNRKIFTQLESEDKYTMYGKHIVNELREITDPLALKSVMHRINTALYEAQAEQYSAQNAQYSTHIIQETDKSTIMAQNMPKL